MYPSDCFYVFVTITGSCAGNGHGWGGPAAPGIVIIQ